MVARLIRVLVVLVLVVGAAGPVAASQEPPATPTPTVTEFESGDAQNAVGAAGVEVGAETNPAGAALSPWQEPAAISEQARMVSAGDGHTCALTAGGGVQCWGRNTYGELGDGTTTNRNIPVDVVGLTSGVAAVSAGGTYFGSHTCALTTGGGVKCWGRNLHGQLGNGTTIDSSTPVDVVGLSSGVAAISARGGHTCALTTGGGVKCWGYNADGQLGNGSTSSSTTPGDVVGLSSGLAAVDSGGNHTCALTASGGVKCWGGNYRGQLGDGTTINSTTPIDVVGLASDVVTISAGGEHNCVLNAGGGVKCWGNNDFGQLGDGVPTSYRASPVDVVGLSSGIITISAGGWDHTCAVTMEGGLKCWGNNSAGQLGDGTTESRSTPVNVVGLPTGMIVVSSGVKSTCALTTGGGVKCWGHNQYGQLGDGTTTNRSTPVNVVGLEGSVYTTIAKAGSNVVLTWLHMVEAVDHYEVYRSTTTPYFEPGSPDAIKLSPEPPAPPDTATEVTFTDTGALGSPGSYFYAVVPVNEGGEFYAASNRTGAFNYGMTPGSGLRRR